MTRSHRNKLNHLVTAMPPGVVLTLPWLEQQGVSAKLAWWYVKSHWLESVGEEAYKKSGDSVTWVGALSALQYQLRLPLHVGGRTALELLGQTHFIPLGGIQQVVLFATTNVRVPRWFRDSNSWKIKLLVNKTVLFNRQDFSLGVINKAIDGINISLSTPERAAIEVVALVPHKQHFDEAAKLIETLSQLRPSLLQNLLERCNSIKAKRLLLYFADKFQHPWLSKLDLTKVDLGKGKRMVGEGGCYDAKYQISVPKIEEE